MLHRELTTKNPNYYATFVGLNDIQRAYAAVGLKTRFVSNGMLYVTYPDGHWRVLYPNFTLNGQGYAGTTQLIISNLREATTPELKLESYDNPLLSLGKLKLQLGTAENPVAGMDFYHELLCSLVGTLTTADLSKGWGASCHSFNRRFPAGTDQKWLIVLTGLKSGEVVMLVAPAKQQPHTKMTTYFVDIAPVSADGTAKLMTEGGPLTFVKNLAHLTAKNKNKAVLVKITGVNLRELKSGIFLPQQ